jgi:hypothetical protein
MGKEENILGMPYYVLSGVLIVLCGGLFASTGYLFPDKNNGSKKNHNNTATLSRRKKTSNNNDLESQLNLEPNKIKRLDLYKNVNYTKGNGLGNKSKKLGKHYNNKDKNRSKKLLL